MRSVDYRDSDRIVTLLTEDYGKISALARGARKSQRRFGGALQPYVLMNAHFRPGRGELAHLERVSVDRSFHAILRNLEAIGAAGAALAVIRERVPDHEPEPAVFDTAVRLADGAQRRRAPRRSLAFAPDSSARDAGLRADARSLCPLRQDAGSRAFGVV